MRDDDAITENDPRAADLNAAYGDGWNDAVKEAIKVAQGWDFGAPIVEDIRSLIDKEA